ncbi:hypothetical protein [Coprobacter sp.]
MRNRLLFIAVLMGCLSLAAQENKLMNSGFEEGSVKPKRGGIENGEWYKSTLPNSSIMPVVNVAYEGEKSLRFVCNDKIDTRYKQFVAQRGLQLSPKKIEVSFYARSANPIILNVAFVGFIEKEKNKTVADRGRNVHITADNNWHLYIVEFDIESGKIVSDKKSHSLDFDEPFELRIAVNGEQDFSRKKTVLYIDKVSVNEKM